VHYLIDGCYGDGNVGDECLLRSVARLVRCADPGARIAAFSSDAAATSADTGLRAIEQCNPFGRNLYGAVFKGLLREAIVQIRHSDVFLLGGGELFRDQAGLSATLGMFYRMRLARMMGKRVFALGVGAQAPTRWWGRSVLRRALRIPDSLVFRDEEALTVAQEVAGDRITACCLPDLVFALDWNEFRRNRSAQEDPDRPLRIGVAIKSLPRRHRCADAIRRLPGLLTETLNRFAATRPCRVSVLPFAESDADPAREITGMLRQTGVNSMPALEPNIERLQREVAAMDCLIAVPFHASVFAFACGVPSVGLSYDAKIERLYQSSGLGELCLDVAALTSEQLARTLDLALAQRHSLSPRLVDLADCARKEVQEVIVRILGTDVDHGAAG
jgi:polysaccharide pyruvyl transferase WcaK-like protein